ncbi:mechanosensitive ion channel [Labilibacter sediminis]|nr:mechanosensitive ion channel [Labilibacter sediminis]
MVHKTKSRYDDFFVKRKLIRRAAYMVPALVIYLSLDLIFAEFVFINEVFHNLVSVYFIVVLLLVVDSFFKSLQDIYDTLPYSKDRPIKGYLQGMQLLFVIIGVLVIVSIIFDIKLIAVFTGLGAIAAVLILVFKDTILGFVASIQLSANNMVKPGDWIEMPSHKADGTVLEMTLNTVKVQNWDKTISTIPTYALVSESFKNWKGMEESGGRRIKRSINIDMKTVKFCTPKMIEKYKEIQFLSDYVEKKVKELKEFNGKFGIDDKVLVNGRRLTNIGVFRKYLKSYLRHHSKIHNDMTFLVRQLQPNEKGIPIEIYVFSNDQEWGNYEDLQSDIFDHILAVIPEFDLSVFQFPTESTINTSFLNEV